MSKCHKKNQRKSVSNFPLYCTVSTFLVIKQLMGGNQVTLCQYPIPYHLLCVGFNIFINDPAILLFSICWMTLYSKQELHLLFHFIFFCVHGPLLYSVDCVIVLIQQIGVLFFYIIVWCSHCSKHGQRSPSKQINHVLICSSQSLNKSLLCGMPRCWVLSVLYPLYLIFRFIYPCY